MNTTFSLHNRIREVRKRLKLRQSDLAEEAGVTRQTIIAIEKSRLNPSVALSLRIARILREPVEYLFYLDAAREDEDIVDGMDAADPGTAEPGDLDVLDAVPVSVLAELSDEADEEVDEEPCSPLAEASAVFEEAPEQPHEAPPAPLDEVQPPPSEDEGGALEWLAETPPERVPSVSEDEGTGQAIWDFV